MQFTTALALFASAFFTTPVLAQPVANSILNYDLQYDNPDGTLSGTACSADLGKTFGSIPNYPYIAGAFFVTEANDADCFTCYELGYTYENGTQVHIPFTIVNQSPGFVSSLAGLHDLTGFTRETFPGNVPITFKQLPVDKCGL